VPPSSFPATASSHEERSLDFAPFNRDPNRVAHVFLCALTGRGSLRDDNVKKNQNEEATEIADCVARTLRKGREGCGTRRVKLRRNSDVV
jgi:hypothetical protein